MENWNKISFSDVYTGELPMLLHWPLTHVPVSKPNGTHWVMKRWGVGGEGRGEGERQIDMKSRKGTS